MADQFTIDLDAYRAARREADQEGPVVRFGGKSYQLPAEMPLEVLGVLDTFNPEMTAGAVSSGILQICRVLLGEDGYAEFMAQKPSLQDATSFFNGVEVDGEMQGGILQAYGFGGPGESPAPDESSESTGAPVKLTSKRTTA